MAMGKRKPAAGVAVHHGRRAAAVGGASVLSEAQRALGRGRLRPLDRAALPAVLRAGRDARPADRSRRASTSACCWSATSRGSTASAASPGGVPTACRCGSSWACRWTERTPDHSTLDQHPQAAAAGGVRGGVPVRADDRGREEAAVGQDGGRRHHDAGSQRGDEEHRPPRHGRGLEGVRHAADARGRRDRRRTRSRPTRRSAGSTRSGRTRRSPTRSGSQPDRSGRRITKMKDGRTHLAYKAEHVVDLESDLILAAEIHPADHGRHADAGRQRDEGADEPAGGGQRGRDRGGGGGQGLSRGRARWSCADCAGLADVHSRAAAARTGRRWTDKPAEHAAGGVRQPAAGAAGQEARRCSGCGASVCERTFAHVCETRRGAAELAARPGERDASGT